MPLRWYGIEDAGRSQIALVEAIGVDEVAMVYLEQCRPDLYVGLASKAEIEDWKTHPVPWVDSDIAKRIVE